MSAVSPLGAGRGPLPTPAPTAGPATTAPGTDPDQAIVVRAHADAERAARRAGVRITLLETPAELAEAEQVLRRVWGARPTDSSIVTPAMMRAIEHAGGYVAGVHSPGGDGVHSAGGQGPAPAAEAPSPAGALPVAAVAAPSPAGALPVAAAAAPAAAAAVAAVPEVESAPPLLPSAGPSDPLVGVCVGFCGAPTDLSLHSHVAGLVAGSVGRGVGRALKLHQRAWALEHGLTSITWTYDPLVSRNAHFNLERLGARLEEYLVDFYGPLEDGVNLAEPSDRALVRWVLDDPRVVALAGAHGAGEGDAGPHGATRAAPRTGGTGDPGLAVLLGEGPGGAPRPGASTATALAQDGAGRALVAVPADIEGLRHRDPGAAHAWRLALRAAMLPLLEHGWEVAGFARGRGYLLERRP